jgi:tetratricopeptide (TPR) repeat protein
MTLPGQFLLVVLGIAAALAAAMVPRTDEWFAVMRDDRKQAQIVATLEPRLAREGNDLTLLATLGRAHADLGNTARAIELIERYLALRPVDAEAYGRLAGLYGTTGETARQRDALERSVNLAPKLTRLTELATLYRALGKADAERTLLIRYEPDLTVPSGLLLRLAQIYAGNDEKLRAIAALSRAEIIQTIPKGARNDEERLLLATLLADTGQGVEAVRLGKMWITQWREPWLANRLLTTVATRAGAPDAFSLADAVADLHPEIRLFLVKQLAEQDAPAVARHLLRTWRLANPRPSIDELAAFLSACREWGEPAIVWEAFAAVLADAVAPEIVARYTNAVAAAFGIRALAPFWSAIPPEALERRPLLAAQLAFAEGDLARTRSLVGAVDVALLDTSDQRIWADLLAAVASPETMFVALRALRQSRVLSRTLAAQYAQLAGSLGHEDEYREALSALRGGK